MPSPPLSPLTSFVPPAGTHEADYFSGKGDDLRRHAGPFLRPVLHPPREKDMWGNMNQGWIRSVVLASCLVLTLGCEKWERGPDAPPGAVHTGPGPGPTPSPTPGPRSSELEGTYSRACDTETASGGIGSTMRMSYRIEKTSFTLIKSTYADLCGKALSTIEVSGTYTVGEEIGGRPGVTPIDFKVAKVQLKYHTAELADSAKSRKEAGHEDWQVDVFKEVTGKDKGSDRYFKADEVGYGLFQLDKRKLYITEWGHDVGVHDKRLTPEVRARADFDFVFLKNTQ